MSGFGWDVVAGRGRSRPVRATRGRGGGFPGGFGARVKQPVKRQRVSTDSTGSANGASKSD